MFLILTNQYFYCNLLHRTFDFIIERGDKYMGKNYNLGNKSDMRRFERDLSKSVQNMAVNAVHSRAITVACPHCKRKFSAHSGTNTCPFCRQPVNLQLDINFK